MKIALVGCGSIGSAIARRIAGGESGVELDCAYDSDHKKAGEFSKKFGVRLCAEFEDALSPGIGLVLEAASQQAVKDLVPRALEAGKNVMIMSTGALMDDALLQKVSGLAKRNGVKIYLPSGAIAGLDGIKSAREEIGKLTIRTTKHPLSLLGAPFFATHPVDLEKIAAPTVIYEGPAREAARLFPANVNVAATLSLAGIGPEKTMVKIIADPSAKSNTHEIVAEGKFGKITTVASNLPSPDNPKTSYLAALSAIATLKRIAEPVQVGT